MKNRPHEGQILSISDLKVYARVSRSGSTRERDGDEFGIVECHADGRWGSAYSYERKNGSEQWTDCEGEPVTVELIHDAPVPRVVGYEEFFGELMVAICEGFSDDAARSEIVVRFAETVRNHVATYNPGNQWCKLALATLRGGRGCVAIPLEFIENITAVDKECFKVYVLRDEFYDRRDNA